MFNFFQLVSKAAEGNNTATFNLIINIYHHELLQHNFDSCNNPIFQSKRIIWSLVFNQSNINKISLNQNLQYKKRVNIKYDFHNITLFPQKTQNHLNEVIKSNKEDSILHSIYKLIFFGDSIPSVPYVINRNTHFEYSKLVKLKEELNFFSSKYKSNNFEECEYFPKSIEKEYKKYFFYY